MVFNLYHILLYFVTIELTTCFFFFKWTCYLIVYVGKKRINMIWATMPIVLIKKWVLISVSRWMCWRMIESKSEVRVFCGSWLERQLAVMPGTQNSWQSHTITVKLQFIVVRGVEIELINRVHCNFTNLSVLEFQNFLICSFGCYTSLFKISISFLKHLIFGRKKN